MRGLDEAREALRRYFGFDAFRPGQERAVGGILSGRDVLAVMPTGAGKSICYQVPSLLLDGATVVVSPLISLMEDQVSSLRSVGISCSFLNSRLGPFERDELLGAFASGACKVLYVAPERLDDAAFVRAVQDVRLSMVVIDEAHCVSQWGQDFRPSYLRIRSFIDGLPERPIVSAFTATATEKVREDIATLLGLEGPDIVVTGFDRPNLRFSVEQVRSSRKAARVLEIIGGFPDDSGIVYCSTRDAVDGLYEELRQSGVSAARYHAGMSLPEREKSQRAFINDDALVMVATNAFGMGIDKSNVRYVVHHNMPGSIEAYYQEAGRAGRDGEPAECQLLWNDADIATCRYFIESDIENEELTLDEIDVVRSSRRRLLSAMSGYCLTTACLREYILNYFGSIGAAGSGDGAADGVSAGCGNCSNCLGDCEEVDVTEEARAVMRCVQELRGRFGKGMVADVLCGSQSTRVRELGMEQCRTYGALEATSNHVKEVIELLAAAGYLSIGEGKYPLVGFGPRYREAAEADFHLGMKKVMRKAKDAKAAKAAVVAEAEGSLSETDSELFERLRDVRKRLADEQGVPPYIVFSNATLKDMCIRRPQTQEEFLDVKGVGKLKQEQYADAFLEEIAR